MKRATEDWQATPNTSQPALPRPRVTVRGRASASIAVGLLASLLLSACTIGSPGVTGPDASEPATAAATEPGTSGAGTAGPGTAGPGAAGPSGSSPAEDPAIVTMKQTVTDALNRLAAKTPKPATAQVTEALTGAGVAAAVLEVSASRTPTGLQADAIESAVLQGTDCVFGHIRDGSVTVTVLPVLASGKCFVGAEV